VTTLVRVKRIDLLEPFDADKINIIKDKYSKAYFVDLPLNLKPDHIWQDIFEREWTTSRNLWDRKVFIIGDTVRLITTPEDMTEKVNWIKEVVAATNLGVNNYYEQMDLRLDTKRDEQNAKIKEEETIARIRTMLRRVSLHE
jgi:hypothetical protein